MARRVEGRSFNFTDRAIERLSSPATGQPQVPYTDAGCPNLSIRVGPGGTKTFRGRFKDPFTGKWEPRTLGRYGDYAEEAGTPVRKDVAWARNEMRLDKLWSETGRSPKERNKRKPMKSTTYAEVLDSYHDLSMKGRNKKAKQIKRALTRHCGSFMNRPIASITADDVQDLCDGMLETIPSEAWHLRAYMHAMFGWARRRRYVDRNVIDDVVVEYTHPESEKFWNDEGIRAAWKATEAKGITETERDLIRIIILTAHRKTAAAGIRRAHVDLDKGSLVTPEEVKQRLNVKKPRSYLTPFTPMTLSILRERMFAKDDEGKPLYPDYLFPGERSGSAFKAWTKLTDKMKKAGAPSDFEYHAWRDTLGTWMQNNGYGEEDVDLMLNHARSSVTLRYMHGYAWDKKLAITERWHSHVQKLVDFKQPKLTIGLGKLGGTTGDVLAQFFPNGIEPDEVAITPEAAAAGIRLVG